MQLEELINKLEDVAKRNDDEFRYRIDLEVRGRGQFGKGVRYEFVCEERADGHAFCSATGSTVDEACANVDVKEACEHWGYEIQ